MISNALRLLFALGIRGIGQQTARDIAELYGHDFNKFWVDLKQAAGEPFVLVK